ncbi:MAG: sodium:proton antiporter [Clostridium sp.]|nr:sodium:proton antiporter [Clostridium sp.]
MISNIAKIEDYVLLFSMCYLSVTIFICLIRVVLGPRFTDRIVAVNIIGLKGIILILTASFYLKDTSYIDIALVYALLSFMTVVILSKLYLVKTTKTEEKEIQREV